MAFCLLSLALVGSAGHHRDPLSGSPRAHTPRTAAAYPGEAASEARGLVTGFVEVIPENVYHATPYNDWPLFEIKVREGQRLKFRREGKAWVGDSPALFVQFETPAEVDTKKEDIEVAALEKAAAESGREVLRTELRAELEAATIRERNARQQLTRLERLLSSKATTQEELQRARNALDLAQSQREQAATLLNQKLTLADAQADLAEHRYRRAQSELALADFKREMSWGNVPVARNQFEEVVVSKVRGVRGDVPTAGSRREAWVEVIDDRVLNVRCHLPADQIDGVAVGQGAEVRQGGRTYVGHVSGVGAVADEKTHLVPVLVEVANADRKLKVNTAVAVGIVGQ